MEEVTTSHSAHQLLLTSSRNSVQSLVLLSSEFLRKKNQICSRGLLSIILDEFASSTVLAIISEAVFCAAVQVPYIIQRSLCYFAWPDQ